MNRGRGGAGSGFAFPTNYFAWWDATTGVSSSGGNLTTWVERNGVYTLAPDAAQTCAVGADDAAYGGHASVGTSGASDQNLVTSATMDFSDTAQVHLFIRGRCAANTATKILVELTAGVNANEGFNINSSSSETWRAAVGSDQTAHDLSTSNTTSVAIVEGIFNRAASGTEAIVRVNGVAGDNYVLSGNATGNFANALLNVFGRSGSTLDSLGSLSDILIYKKLQSPAVAKVIRSVLSA